MDSVSEGKIRENLEIQLSEIETLHSMFCNPGELRIEDPKIVEEMKLFLENADSYVTPPNYLDLTVNLLVDTLKFEMCINLSQEYPSVEPDLYVRNHKLTKRHHAQLNKDLKDYVESLDRDEPCIFSAISWLQDNALNYIVAEEKTENNGGECGEKSETLVRYWIYSHHIYSKTKRREIVDLAASLNITGFCMPGKPGVVCVEGTANDCNEWWQAIKAMNWKRIFCKYNEECRDANEDFLKFTTFEERVFQNNSIKCNHMDMGELYKFLEEHKCGYAFKEIFGVEAR